MVEPMNQSSPLRAVERRRLDEQVAGTIADAIIGGQFAPGSSLPPERELSEQLGVNRTSLRQGLARLEQMGLIEARQGSGNVVCDPSVLVDPFVVEALVRRLGPDFLAEMLEVRTALGPLIGALAAANASEEDLAALAVALEAVDDATTAPDRQAADLNYFAVLIVATKNRALALLLRWVETVYGGRTHELTAAFGTSPDLLDGLRRIHTAVRARDEHSAAAAVEAHLRDSARRMMQSFTDSEASLDRTDSMT